MIKTWEGPMGWGIPHYERLLCFHLTVDVLEFWQTQKMIRLDDIARKNAQRWRAKHALDMNEDLNIPTSMSIG